MPQRLKLSTMNEKRLKMSRCGQFKSLWHSRLGQSFLLVLSCHQGMVALLRGYNNLRPKLVGLVASILALPLLLMEWIHAVVKASIRPVLWIAILFFIILLIILQFFSFSLSNNPCPQLSSYFYFFLLSYEKSY
jgi:hypothetical protein